MLCQMDGFREIWFWQSTYLFFVFVSGIMGCFLGKLISKVTSAIFRWLGLDKNSTLKVKEAEAIKKATLQIGQDWMKMMEMLEDIHGEQTSFLNRLQPEMESRNQNLYHNITVSLEQEFLRNDLRFKKFKGMIESMHEGISLLKNPFENFIHNEVSKTDKGVIEKASLVDSCAQTEYEIKRKPKDGHSKNSLVTENEGSKLVCMVKECLTGVINEAKHQICIDREDENRELQNIFKKLAEDRKEMKKTIIQAFSLAAEQARRNFDHFGQEAIHYIDVLNNNTNKMLKIKFEETDERLKEILSVANRQILDVVTIQKILENIDDQFDDIFQRVELGCQRNTENCEEIAQNLENTSYKWINATSELGCMTNDLSNNIEMFKDMLDDMKGMIRSINAKSTDNHHSASTEGDEIVCYDSTGGTASQDIMTLSQKKLHFVFMYNVIKSCYETLTQINSNIKDGCTDICQQFQILTQRLQSLNASAETLENVIKNVNMENFAERIVCVKCTDHNPGEIGNIAIASTRDSGDCLPDMNIRRRTTSFKDTLAKIIQEYSGTINGEETEIIDLLLKKTSKDNDINPNEIALNDCIQKRNSFIADESQAITIEDRS